MQIYLVGGAVRDTLMGLPVKDRDWVVVGATPQQLIAKGYVPVGKDFPVFLHPRSREQYALARTERKTAPGYRGFAVHAAPDVTLEQDLSRRDLTINAMAIAAEHLQPDSSFDPARIAVIDPHQGRRDVQAQRLRHVSPAFREDPVRILRVARFAARFAAFDVAAETMELMRAMVRDGEAEALVAERVWQELATGLQEAAPWRMFDVLAECGALNVLLPELSEAGAKAVSSPPHVSAKAVLEQAVRVKASVPVRFACLCLQVEAHSGQAAAAPQISSLCQRLRAPADIRQLAEVTARERGAIDASTTRDAAGLVRLLERCDAFRKPARLQEILLACECDARAGGLPPNTGYAPGRLLAAALQATLRVQTDVVAAGAQAAGASGPQIGDAVRAERTAAVNAILQTGPAWAW